MANTFAFDPRALGAAAMASNAAYRRPATAAPAPTPALPTPAPLISPAQNMTGAGALSTTPLANSPWAAAQAAASAPRQYNMNDPSRFVTPQSSGIHMGGQSFSPGIQAVTQALTRQPVISPNQNMTGPNAQPNLGNMGMDIFGLKAKQAAAQAAMQPPAPAQAPAQQLPTIPGDWARQFFGSSMGNQYGNGNGQARLNGWAQMNPAGVQRWADAGHVPQPTGGYMQSANRR